MGSVRWRGGRISAHNFVGKRRSQKMEVREVEYWKNLAERRIFISVCFVLMLLSCLAYIAGDKVYAQERIILKGVPYFCQKWHFD